ncbi:MAG: winged helix DNA-binding protein [Sphingomonadaceae bacterium]
MLDLFAAGQEGKSVGVSSACIAANVPATTALRCIQWLCDHDLVERVPNPTDGRSVLLRTTDSADRAMTAYLDDIG